MLEMMYQLYPRLVEQLCRELALGVAGGDDELPGLLDVLSQEVRSDQHAMERLLGRLLEQHKKNGDRLLADLGSAAVESDPTAVQCAFDRWREEDRYFRHLILCHFSHQPRPDHRRN